MKNCCFPGPRWLRRPARLRIQICTSNDTPSEGEDWLRQVKHDGWLRGFPIAAPLTREVLERGVRLHGTGKMVRQFDKPKLLRQFLPGLDTPAARDRRRPSQSIAGGLARWKATGSTNSIWPTINRNARAGTMSCGDRKTGEPERNHESLAYSQPSRPVRELRAGPHNSRELALPKSERDYIETRCKSDRKPRRPAYIGVSSRFPKES